MSDNPRSFADGYRIVTATGSVYAVGREAGTGHWWVWARNVPNPSSRRLPQRWWRIVEPELWPPRLGLPFRFEAPLELRRDDPERVPGGGKWTSPVRLLTTLTPGKDSGEGV